MVNTSARWLCEGWEVLKKYREIYLEFISFLDIEMARVFEIQPHRDKNMLNV